jgi:hypothetical protein
MKKEEIFLIAALLVIAVFGFIVFKQIRTLNKLTDATKV